MSSSPPSVSAEKKHWWMSNRKVAGRYLKDARALIATQEPSHVSSALGLLDAALALSPRSEVALELKARSLLYLRRFRDVADMLQDYIPSFKEGADVDDSSTSLSSESSVATTTSSSSSSSSKQLYRERLKLLPLSSSSSFLDDGGQGPDGARCLSVSNLKRRLLAGLGKSGDGEGQWRYIVLGQACSHLGMMEDAVVLLQTGRRLASAASRRDSHHLPDDFFSFSASDAIDEASSVSTSISAGPSSSSAPPAVPPTELDSASHLLSSIKLLLRRRAAAVAALDAGLPTESARHFSKILDGRRGVPHSFAAGCLVGRAAAYHAAGRIVESIADCNRALALDPASIPALRARADLLESVGSLPDCLRDLDHLKLLYDAILRDRKLPGPLWRPHGEVRYRDIPGDLRELLSRIQELRQRVARGEAFNVDYHALVGVRRGCTRSELERAYLLLCLKHQPDRAAAFVDRLEFGDEHRDIDAVRDQAKMSASMLYRLLQKGYCSIMSSIMDEEAVEKQRRLREATAATAASPPSLVPESAKLPGREQGVLVENGKERNVFAPPPSTTPSPETTAAAAAAASAVFQGVFCRDLAAVGSLFSQVGFNQTMQVTYEALSC
ncbi:hypothetical protein Taro_017335 [Colocasia esculenta]|uniref:J domain-containing protein n=1 Tax=Colocasia esculenta TaxID=4460 RepID=A0A843UZ37_COLES|nr:hypothetical protein [Colocasia esculenta]